MDADQAMSLSNWACHKTLFLALHCSFCTSMTCPNRLTQTLDCLFTDDTICQCPVSTKEDQAKLNNDLDKLSVWKDKQSMSFHPEMCQALRMSRSRKKLARQYCIVRLSKKSTTTSSRPKTLSGRPTSMLSPTKQDPGTAKADPKDQHQISKETSLQIPC